MAKAKLSDAVNNALARLFKRWYVSQQEKIVQSFLESFTAMKPIISRDQDKLTMEEKNHFEDLKDAVRDSEDLLEEVSGPTVRFPLPYTKIRDIKQLSDRLKICSEIVTQSGNSGSDDGYLPFGRGAETTSDMNEKVIIGREGDKEALVGMLLSHSDTDVSYVSIVGLGGIGKTTLAQLVYNDERVRDAFGLRLWVCVGDQDSFDSFKGILSMILQVLEGEISVSNLPIDELKKQVWDKIQGKRFFLVLDDVWSENRQQWIILKKILNVGARGSTVLVTTRSLEVARIMGDSYIHQLSCLSVEDSWSLFKRRAFFPGQESDPELVHLGKEILKICFNNPLSITVVASMLRNQGRSKWLSLRTALAPKEMSTAFAASGGDSIMQSLKLSYSILPPDLKSCVVFCSIFPKDYVIVKEVLTSMWLALGYLVPTKDNQSMEDIGEEYCSTLLSRSFFQDTAEDEYGQVISFKMHDLIHDLVLCQAQEEFHALSYTNTGNLLEKKIRHLSISESSSSIDLFANQYLASNTLRTIFNLRNFGPCSSNHVSAILSRCRFLRILDLQGVALETLPDTFDTNVPHLRYLDLSGNEILRQLPTSITKLNRLQILRLRGCKGLIELPKDMGKLVELRTLNIAGCDKLTSIPSGMSKWSCVHMFTMSIVGDDNFNHGNRDKVKDMKDLVNLKGDILVEVEKFSPRNMPNTTEAYILKDASLQALDIICTDGSSNQGIVHETLLEIKGYRGYILSSITLSHCSGLQHLTVLSQLRHLKRLRLLRLCNVESIEGVDPTALTSGAMNSMIFFPSLEKLVLEWMPNLKGWWRDLTWMEIEAGDGCFVDRNGSSMGRVILPIFSCLRDLTIRNCPLMTYFPPCPHVKQFELKGVNENFCMKGFKGSAPLNPEPAESNNSRDLNLCLDKLKVYYHAMEFSSLFGKSIVQTAVDIDMKYFFKEESLQVFKEGFQRCASSLKYLSIDGFYKLKSLSGGGLEYLTNLQSLSIKECLILDLEEAEVEEEEEGMPWKSLRSLSSLTLDDIPKLVNLPKGFQYLSALHSLHIKSCSNLEALGDCVRFLTSLESLHIEDCINLKTLPECLNSPAFQQILLIENCPKLESAAS